MFVRFSHNTDIYPSFSHQTKFLKQAEYFALSYIKCCIHKRHEHAFPQTQLLIYVPAGCNVAQIILINVEKTLKKIIKISKVLFFKSMVIYLDKNETWFQVSNEYEHCWCSLSKWLRSTWLLFVVLTLEKEVIMHCEEIQNHTKWQRCVFLGAQQKVKTAFVTLQDMFWIWHGEKPAFLLS